MRKTMTSELATRREQKETAQVAVRLDGPIIDLDQAWRVAVALAQSDLVPMSLQGKPSNVLLVMMRGAELDLSPAQSVALIYAPAQGQTQLRGQFVLARLKLAGYSYDWEYSD